MDELKKQIDNLRENSQLPLIHIMLMNGYLHHEDLQEYADFITKNVSRRDVG